MNSSLPEFSEHRLWYDRPAREWWEALPVGNGRLGAMVFGGPGEERLQVNDDTLYSGEPGLRNFVPDLTKTLAGVRELLAAGRYAEAEKIVGQSWLGMSHSSYQPMADLRIAFSHSDEAVRYRRELHLADGIAIVRYEAGGVVYEREVFASQPHDVLVCRLTASHPGALAFSASLASPHPGTEFCVEKSEGVLLGRAPVFAFKRSLRQMQVLGDARKYPELFDEAGHPREGAAPVRYETGDGARGMRFAVMARIFAGDGTVHCNAEGWHVEGATSVVIVLSTGTSFAGFRTSPSREGCDPEEKPRRALRHWPGNWQAVRDAHVSDFRRLFGRMDLWLGDASERPTSERREAFVEGRDPGFTALHFQFARYLIISASRPGTEPMNLQGLWNAEVVPPWNCGYTLNINTEMNYWLVEAANLADCHEPLLRLAREAAENGRGLARGMFGAEGWVCFHNLSIWRDVQPSDGKVCWAFWPMAQAWLSQHAWMHYEYSGDLRFLRDEAFPLLRDAARFFLSWLVTDENGVITTPAGTSPENTFAYASEQGMATASICAGPTMDFALMRECLESCRQAARLLAEEAALCQRIDELLPKLAPYRIGKRGQLQEWSEDFEEPEPDHRHVSHLYGVYPGRQITREETPELCEAARKSLDRRGDHSTGWSLAWKACLWARLGDGDRALRLLRGLQSSQRAWQTLLQVEPPFQIDANLGAPAALLEMMLQSRGDRVEFLPALPMEFGSGAVRGLRARGGLEVDFRWTEHRLVWLEVRSRLEREFEFCHCGKTCRVRVRPGASLLMGRDFAFA